MKARKNIISVLFILLTMILGGCGELTPQAKSFFDEKQEYEKEMLVRISTWEQRGNGVIYDVGDNEIYVVTAAHILEKDALLVENAGEIKHMTSPKLEVTFVNDVSVSVNKYYVSEDADVAILVIPYNQLDRELRKKLCIAKKDKESFDLLKAGDEIITAGYRERLGNEEVICEWGTVIDSWIYLEDYGQYMMLVSAPVVLGMSGGGCFDQQGQLVGIISGINEEQETAVVPLSVIEREFLLIPEK